MFTWRISIKCNVHKGVTRAQQLLHRLLSHKNKCLPCVLKKAVGQGLERLLQLYLQPTERMRERGRENDREGRREVFRAQ